MSIRFEKEGRIATLTIDRPEKMNALTMEMYDQVSARLRQIDEDDDIWVGIVTGAGERAFCAGADLVMVHEAAGSQPWVPLRPQRRFDLGLEVQKPLIAAINGYCLAGGLELALVCDIRIATESALFGTPEVRWNLLHGFGAQVLPDIIGVSNALYLLLMGDFIDAREAHRLGLVQEVVPVGHLMGRARQLAERICQNGPIAVRLTKDMVRRSRDMTFLDGLRLYQEYNRIVHASEDLVEGTRAFQEKRSPQFKGH